MSRRGHLYGMISTYHHSWFLKTDGLGNLLVSDAVGADARGDAEHVSVTEVCSVDICTFNRFSFSFMPRMWE